MGANVAESADMPDMLSVSQHMAQRENKTSYLCRNITV